MLHHVPKKRTGLKPNKIEALKSWVRLKLPNGLPAGVKNDAILHDFHKETGVKASERTLRRAIVELAVERSE